MNELQEPSLWRDEAFFALRAFLVKRQAKIRREVLRSASIARSGAIMFRTRYERFKKDVSINGGSGHGGIRRNQKQVNTN